MMFVSWAALTGNALGLLGVGLFVAYYARVRFEATALGRALMLTAAAVFILGLSSLLSRLSRLTPLDLADRVWIVGLVGVAWSIVGSAYLWVTFRHVNRGDHP